MPGLIQDLFRCKACDAHQDTIAYLNNEIAYLRQQNSDLVARLVMPEQQPAVHTMNEPRPRLEAVPSAGSANWSKIRASLENKYRKKKEEVTPEEKVGNYWDKKIQDMEKEAFDASSVGKTI